MSVYQSLFEDLATSARNTTPLSASAAAVRGFSSEQADVLALPFSGTVVLRAGAGSGKTRVLVERAARLVEAGVDPARIALVSFTRRSAEELTQRLRVRLKGKKTLPVSATLHALALRFEAQKRKVRLHPELVQSILPQLRRELGSVSEMSDKDLLTTLGRYRESLRKDGTFGLAAERLAQLLVENESDDFTSLLEKADVPVDQRFQHLLVDEAQDLSPLQQDLIGRLILPSSCVWYVGDDDQAIFAFRGAQGTLLQQLALTSSHAMALSLNWRCPVEVIDAANALMTHAPGRDALQWRPGVPRSGALEWLQCSSVDDEVARAVAASKAGRLSMVLGRTNKGLEPFSEAGLPCCTVHEAKGSEWDHVWLQGAAEGRFPLLQAEPEEERRLFYVAVTRAKVSLTVSWAGAPSQFIAQCKVY